MRYLKNKELLVIIIIYIFITIDLRINKPILYTNILNPLFWGGVLIYLIWDIKKWHVRFNNNRIYFKYIIIISCLYIIFYFHLGFILGFNKSPYNHNLLSIIENVIIQILPIIAIEVTRSVICTRNKNNKLALVLIIILLILTEINYTSLVESIASKEKFFKYIFGTIVPLISNSMLYTYLTLKGSYSLPLVLRLTIELSVLLIPILPNTDWFISGTIEILSSTLIYMLFKYNFSKKQKNIRKKQKDLGTKISYEFTLIFCITLVSFMLGFFKYKAISILSNSMIPTFSKGDVVIFEKVNENEQKEIPQNSIIIYSMGKQNIAHRIVKKIKENDTILYQTKGDSNKAPDANLVQKQQIQGVYIFHIKYIGFPSIWLYNFLNNEDAKVETN